MVDGNALVIIENDKLLEFFYFKLKFVKAFKHNFIFQFISGAKDQDK